MYFVYILYSKHLDKFYIGYTGDSLEVRLFKHLQNHRGFTAKAKDWEIVYSESYITKAEAMAREKQIKNWKNKQRVIELIARSSTE